MSRFRSRVLRLWWRVGFLGMAAATVVIFAQVAHFNTPRSALSESALAAYTLGQQLKHHCLGTGTPLPEEAITYEAQRQPPRLAHEKARDISRTPSGAVRLRVVLASFWDFEPWQSLDYALPDNALLVLEGRCVAPSTLRWYTAAETSLPPERLPRLLRKPTQAP